MRWKSGRKSSNVEDLRGQRVGFGGAGSGLLNFIPIIGNVFSAVLGAIFSFYYNALDFLDYPMTRKKMKFRQKLRVTQSGKLLTYGFGCTAFLLMFLPIVNVFMKPILVVAGTSLYYEKDYNIII